MIGLPSLRQFMGHLLYRDAQPLMNRPLCPDTLIWGWFSGREADAYYQRSQGAMTTEILDA
jgi:hypothetical protein